MVKKKASETLDMQWSIKHRPSSLEDVAIGNPEILDEITQSASKTQAMLLLAPTGSGKTTIARIVATMINGSLAGCIEEDSTRQGINDIRELTQRLRYKPPSNKWVVILDEVHGLSKDAFTALLKLLEDPPSRTLFILLTNHGHKLPKEVENRCRSFELLKPDTQTGVARLLDILKIERFKGTSKEAKKMATLALTSADFCMRQAVQNLESMYDRFKATGRISELATVKSEVNTDTDTAAIGILKALNHAYLKGEWEKPTQYIFKVITSMDENVLLGKMSGCLYYGKALSYGGNWVWQAKLYQDNKLNIDDTAAVLILDSLMTIGTGMSSASDTKVYLAAKLSKLAVDLARKKS